MPALSKSEVIKLQGHKKPQLPSPQTDWSELMNTAVCQGVQTHLTSQSPPANPDFHISAVSSQRETISAEKG